MLPQLWTTQTESKLKNNLRTKCFLIYITRIEYGINVDLSKEGFLRRTVIPGQRTESNYKQERDLSEALLLEERWSDWWSSNT